MFSILKHTNNYTLVKSTITYSDFFNNILSNNTNLFDTFLLLLNNLNYENYYIEIRPVTYNLLNTFFEFAIIKSPIYAKASYDCFKEHGINENTNGAKKFSNLSGDTTLISPCYNRNNDISTYGHIGIFLKKAMYEQIINLFKETIKAFYVLSENNQNKVYWISTHGHGVPWLHIRIDDKPKYIQYNNYKNMLM